MARPDAVNTSVSVVSSSYTHFFVYATGMAYKFPQFFRLIKFQVICRGEK